MDGEEVLVSVWWVVVAMVGGGCLGVLVMAMLRVAGREDRCATCIHRIAHEEVRRRALQVGPEPEPPAEWTDKSPLVSLGQGDYRLDLYARTSEQDRASRRRMDSVA